MAPLTRIQQLAESIKENAAFLQQALAAKGLPNPASEPNAGVHFPLEVLQARNSVMDATQELNDLIQDPMRLVQSKIAHNQMASMKACYRYRITEQFAPGEQISYHALAQACRLEEKPLQHLLRHAILMRIFQEPKRGFVAHTAASVMLRDLLVLNWLTGGTEWLWPSSVRPVDALEKWPNIAHNTEQPLHRMLENDPAFAKVFADSMTATIANTPAFDGSYINGSYDWSSLNDALVVDIGGSQGPIAVGLAKEFSSLRFIVQDLEATISGAEATIPADLKSAGRVKFMVHDFSTPQPVQADAYILWWIFHNWSDKYSVKILQALIPALKPGARILVHDSCLPDPGTVSGWIEKDIRDLDLLMTTWFNSYERDADEWKELFAKASPRFEFVGITQPDGSALSLIEARFK